MKLKTVARSATQKGEVKKLRREGLVPAVLYVRGKEGETLAIHSSEFSAFLRGVKPGHLPTSVFSLEDASGKTRRAIIKDIHYDITTYNVIHLDFEELIEGQKINVKVPVEFTGLVDCVGVKLGGVLRQVIRHIRVRCLPADLPTSFELDVRELGLGQSKRLSDLSIPETIRPIMDANEVIAAIVKR